MNATLAEVQLLADQILALLRVRLWNGDLVVRYCEGRVRKLETHTVHQPTPRPAAPNHLSTAAMRRGPA